MARSTQRAVSDGTLVSLDLSINYINRSEISVYFNSELTTEWAWVGETAKQITFSTAVPNGVEVLVKRTTDISKLRHEFSKGAAFTAEVLDEDLTQVLHIAQEASETNINSQFYADIDMHTYRVRNIGTAVDDTDALTLGQYKADALGAFASKTAAAASAEEAAGYATAAAGYAAAADSGSAATALLVAHEAKEDPHPQYVKGILLSKFGAKFDGSDESGILASAILHATSAKVAIIIDGIIHVGTATKITVPILDTIGQIFTPTSSVTIENGMQVRPEWFGSGFSTILRAIDALPSSGGVVRLSNKRYAPNDTHWKSKYISKDNVSIVGEKMPSFSTDCSTLVGGSVIEGRLNVWANNFSIENVGVDCGKYVVDKHWPGADTSTANYPLNGGNWDAFAFAQPDQNTPQAARTGFKAKNLIGLCYDSHTIGHAVLMEGINGGFIDNVVGCGATHACVIKSMNIAAGAIAGYGANTNNVIIKSDSYAVAKNIAIDQIDASKQPPGTSHWSPPVQPTHGVLLNPYDTIMESVHIGTVRAKYASTLFMIDSPNNYITDVLTIGAMDLNGYGATGVMALNLDDASVKRSVKIGDIVISNVADGAAFNSPANSPFKIGSISLTNISLRALQSHGSSRVVVDSIQNQGTTNILYEVDDYARISVGKEYLGGQISVKFSKNAPALDSSWGNVAGNAAFRVILEGYGVVISGLVAPYGGGDVKVCSLPKYLLPTESIRLPVIAKGKSGVSTICANASSTTGGILINEGVNSNGAETWLSLNSLSWVLD